MKKAQFLWTTLLGLALLGLMAGPGMNVGAMQTTTPTPTTGGPWPGMMGGQGTMWPGMMGPGMPGGQGMWPGMMGGMMGPGMVGGQGIMGPGMMGGTMGVYPATVTPITQADAKQRLATFVAAARTGCPGRRDHVLCRQLLCPVGRREWGWCRRGARRSLHGRGLSRAWSEHDVERSLGDAGWNRRRHPV